MKPLFRNSVLMLGVCAAAMAQDPAKPATTKPAATKPATSTPATSSTQKKAAPAKTAAAKPATTPAKPAAPKTNPKLLNPAALKEKAPETFQAKFETTKGTFVVESNRAWSPAGVDRFYNLVKNGYFDGTAFFRVVPGFVVQWGIHHDPKVSAAWRVATIPDEPVVEGNKRGYISFAKGGPNTRSTQFFINYADNSRLDGMGFPAIARVTEGMDVVDQIYPGYGESPQQPMIQGQGRTYLEANFPKLDVITKATVITPAAKPAAAPATKKSTAPAKKAAAPATAPTKKTN